MSSFSKGPNPEDYTPFGKNSFLRSTQDVKTESFTIAASTVAEVEIDGSTQKILQPGTVLAKITSGADSGKVGPVDSGATDGREVAANIVGINNTFLPWQLLHHDEPVSVAVEARVYQARCLEYVAGVESALTNATADAMVGGKSISILFA